MSRNAYKGSEFIWVEKQGETITCFDRKGNQLFHIFDEDERTNLVNAYLRGFQKGINQGREEFKADLRRLLGVPEIPVINN